VEGGGEKAFAPAKEPGPDEIGGETVKERGRKKKIEEKFAHCRFPKKGNDRGRGGGVQEKEKTPLNEGKLPNNFKNRYRKEGKRGEQLTNIQIEGIRQESKYTKTEKTKSKPTIRKKKP